MTEFVENRITVVSANVSFVTSYPDVFNFPASENAALFALLKKNFGDDINHDELISLFNKSISSIKSKLVNESNESNYSAAGLQELNNTEEVYEKVYNLLNENDGFNFICSNVLDEYFGTKPCVGFIVKEPLDNFIPISDNVKGKLFTVKRADNKDDSLIGFEAVYNNQKYYPKLTNEEDQNKEKELLKKHSFTLLSENPQYISIRDLGSMDQVGNTGNYCLRQTHNNGNPDARPDSGRPIAMIIKGTTDKPEIVHINCHMPNPSLLKTCKKNEELFEDISNKPTILQNHNSENSENPETDIWLAYCRQRLSTTIIEMLGDFGISNLANFTNTTWIITGDFNDIGTLLKDSLGTEGITVFGDIIYFTFKDVGPTCCPNTNSSGGKDENIINPPFNRPFSALGSTEEKINIKTDLSLEQKKTEIEKMNKDKTIYKDQYYSENVSNSVFDGLLIKGDNCGFGRINQKPTGKISAEIFPKNREEQGSDHLFVVATYDPTQNGGYQNAGSRKRKSTKTTKKTQKRKHTKRQNKRKPRHHSKRR